ncbi:MAG: hypothetical protein ACJ8BE_17910, partial [Microvirga sp.]
RASRDRYQPVSGQSLLERRGRRLHRGGDRSAGCSAFGETQSEAIIELQNAIKAWIAAASAAGNAIPPPRRKVA